MLLRRGIISSSNGGGGGGGGGGNLLENALLLNGTDQGGQVTSTASIVLAGAQCWSVWIYLDSTADSYPLSKAGPSLWRGAALRVFSGGIRGQLYKTVGSTSGATTIDHTTVLATGQWYHVTLSYDGSQWMSVTVDGVKESVDYFANAGTTVIGTSTDDFFIGQREGGSRVLSGSIALPMMFNADIDQTELIDGSGNARAYSALTAGLKSACVLAPTLVNDIPADGEEEDDQSGNSNDVTLLNSPTYTGENITVAT